MIRVESEETQDYVREAMDLGQEEAEATSFVPRAISVPPKPLFRCDNLYFSFWQFASVVVINHDQLVPAMPQQDSGGKRR